VALSVIASINVGLIVARISKPTEVRSKGHLKYRYITLSSAENGMAIDESKLREFEAEKEVDEKFITRLDDIVIGISSPHSIVQIDKQAEGLVIPSQFAVIRTTSEAVLPKYLIAYMNSDEVREKIEQMSRGVLVKTINAVALQSLEIKMPNMTKQNKIAKLRELLNEENRLNLQYAGLVKKKNNYYLNNFVSEGGNKNG